MSKYDMTDSCRVKWFLNFEAIRFNHRWTPMNTGKNTGEKRFQLMPGRELLGVPVCPALNCLRICVHLWLRFR